MPRLRPPLANLLLCVIAVLLVLLAAEALWRFAAGNGDRDRVFDTRMRFVNPPNTEWTIHTEEYTTRIGTNSLGFRGPEMPDSPKGGELRILFLGDSFVEAKQVALEDRFAEQAERVLAARLGRDVVARALAVGGANPATELLYYREVGKAYAPDFVVQVLFPENDLLRREGPYRLQEGSDPPVLADIWVEPAPPCGWKCAFLKRSMLARHIYHGLRNRNTRTEAALASLADYYWYTNEGQAALVSEQRWDVFRALVGALRKDVETDGSVFLAVLMPGAFEIQGGWREEYIAESAIPAGSWRPEALMDQAAAVLLQDGIRVLDLRPAFRAADPDAEPLYYRKDPHLSLRGHGIVAEAVAAALAGLR